MVYHAIVERLKIDHKLQFSPVLLVQYHDILYAVAKLSVSVT